MGTLSSCLKKIGLSEHEAAILRGSADENIKDGDAAQVAAVRAVADYLEQLEKERDGIAAQVAEKNGRITAPPFKLAELSDLTKILRKEEDQPQSNWRDSVSSYDGAKVYNYNPDTGAYWASMRNLRGNAYDITYFKGQTEIEKEEVSGGLTATKLMVAEKVRAMQPAVEAAGIHVENGEIERVTPAVVAESVKKSAKNTDFNPKQALAWLKGEVTKAIKAAPTAKEKGVWDNVKGKLKLEGIMNVDEAIGFKVFDVPGDGKFKVLNLKESLEKFLASAEKSPGFKTVRNEKPQLVAPWQKTDGSGSEAEVREMLNDGDYTAAYEFSKQIGKPMVFSFAAKRHPVPITDVRSFEVEGYEDFNFVSGRSWFGKDSADKWQIIDLSSGNVVSSGSSRKAVETKARADLSGKVTPEKLAKLIAEKLQSGEAKPQDKLETDWMSWADQQEGGSLLSEPKEEATSSDISSSDAASAMSRIRQHGKDYRNDENYRERAIESIKAEVEYMLRGKDANAHYAKQVADLGEEAIRSIEKDWADKLAERKQEATTKQVKDDNGNTVTEVTLPSGKVVQIQRLNSTESMGLPGWHGPDGYLADTKDAAIKELVDRDAKQSSTVNAENEQKTESLKIGDAARIMGKDVILARVDEVDSVRYELFNDAKMSSNGGAIRTMDMDSGQVIMLKSYNDYDKAESDFNDAISIAKQDSQDQKTESEPNPLDYTPKQYHEAYMAYVAKEYGLSLAEVKEDYDTDVSRSERNKEWISAVRAAARDGKELSRQMLDKLYELNENAVTELMHDYPEAKIPDGYQNPAARKTEKQNADDKKADRASTKQSADAGEELTYNKRNRRKGGLSWDDIADKNATLQAKEVVKAKVYPKPDYEALVAGGMKPVIAHIVKQVYDAIAAKPKLMNREVLSETSMKAYIDGVNRVMEGTLKWANDPKAVASWAGRQSRLSGSSFSVMDTFSKDDLPVNFVYPDGWKAQRAEVNYLGGNKMLGALQPGYEEVARAVKDMKLGWPAKADAWKKQGYKIVEAVGLKTEARSIERKGRNPFVYVVLTKVDGSQKIADWTIEGTTDVNSQEVQDNIAAGVQKYNNKFVLLDKVDRVAGIFDSQEDAEEGAKEVIKKVKDDGEVKEIGRVVTEVERVGADRRMEGQDVSAQDLISTFGFRGVNFGNSMQGESKALVKERQLHLNHIYDAFMDLAELLNVPPQAMSLNGMLGIAVGAQGSGKALAHFVPGVNEINITRRAGAGALAHEWGHAFDHYFATQAGLATRERPYLTSAVSGARQETVKVDGKLVTRDIAFEGVRPEIVDQFRTIVQTMQKRKETPEERVERLQEAKEAAFEKLQSWLNYYRREVKKDGGEKASAAIDKIDDIERRAKNLEVGDGAVAISKKYAVAPLMIELGQVYEEATGKKFDPEYLNNTNYYVDRMKVIDGQLKADTSHDPAIVDTSYYRSSKSADSKKQEYWSTPLEMFARAFDAYVVDSLAEKNAKNEYLSGIEAVPPKGEERNDINRAFDFLIAELKTKETDKGVAIYNLTDTAPIPESEWIPTGQLVDQVNGLLKQFKTEIPVTVIDTEDEVLPSSMAVDNGQSTGFVYRGRIHLVRSGLASPESVVATVFHELLHFGIRRFVPRQEYIAQMRALYKSDPWIQAKTEEWLDKPEGKETALRFGGDYAAARGVDEALAELAEELHIDRTAPGVTVGDRLRGVVQNVIQWMKKLAAKFGWKPVVERLDDLKAGQEAKDYVESIFKKLREGAPPSMMNRAWAYSDPAFSKRIPFVAQEETGYLPTLRKVIAMFKSGDRRKMQEAGNMPIPIGRTPVVLRQIIDEDGSKPFKRSDYVVGQGSTIYLKADNSHGTSFHLGKIGIDVLEQLPSLLADPVAVFKSSASSSDPESFKVLTDATDIHGNPVVVAIKPNVQMRQLNNARVHLHATIFPATWEGVQGWSDAGGLRYYNEKSPFANVVGSNRREVGSESDHTGRGFDPILGVKKSKVKVITKGEVDGLPASAYSKDATHSGASPQDIRNTLNQRFGESGIRSMERAGVLKIMRLADAPEDIRRAALQEGASALYTEGGVAYLFSDRMTPEQAPGKLMHELGEHHGLERMLGADGWQRLMRRLTTMAKVRGSVAQGAWDGVKANYGEFNGMSDQELAGNERFIHEVLAALGENAEGQKTSLLREIVATVKAWLAERGFLIESITEADIGKLIEGSLKKVMRESASGAAYASTLGKAMYATNSMVAPETIEQTVLDNFRQIVDAMKSAKQLVEECA